MESHIQKLINQGLLSLGKGSKIEDSVIICHREESNTGSLRPVVIGDHSIIRSGAIIYEGVQIGSHCRIGHGCILRRQAVLGNHVVLSHYVIVEYESKLGNWVRISPHTHITSQMTIEDRAFLGAGVKTVNDKYLVWNHQNITPKLLAPYVEYGARIGTGSILCYGIRIGRLAMVGSRSVVTKDVSPKTVVYGNPARPKGILNDDLKANGLDD